MCSRKMDIRNQAEADPLLMWKPINFLFIENFYVPKSLRYPEYWQEQSLEETLLGSELSNSYLEIKPC